MKKRALTLLLALIMCLSLCTPVFANEVEPYEVRYYYKTEQLGTYQTYARGLPKGQDIPKYFKSGDTLYYTISGGVTVTGSVSVSLPEPYNFISFSMDIGSIRKNGVTGSGKGLDDEQPEGIYYLMITKHFNADAYVVYRRRVGTTDTPENWTIDHTGVLLDCIYYEADLITPEAAKAYGLM